MNDDKRAVNPHTGQPLPEDATPKPPSGTPGASAASGEVAAAAKQAGPPQLSSTPSAQELAVRSVLETVMDPFCPYAPQMMADVKQATESAVPQPAEVEILADAWSPDMMPDPGLLGFSY
jgi:hypothetical protein